MKRRGLSLVDVLAAALVRSEGRCGPPVLALTSWGPEWLELQSPDVQRSVQRQPAVAPVVPVILGTQRPAA